MLLISIKCRFLVSDLFFFLLQNNIPASAMTRRNTYVCTDRSNTDRHSLLQNGKENRWEERRSVCLLIFYSTYDNKVYTWDDHLCYCADFLIFVKILTTANGPGGKLKVSPSWLQVRLPVRQPGADISSVCLVPYLTLCQLCISPHLVRPWGFIEIRIEG